MSLMSNLDPDAQQIISHPQRSLKKDFGYLACRRRRYRGRWKLPDHGYTRLVDISVGTGKGDIQIYIPYAYTQDVCIAQSKQWYLYL